MRTTLVAAALVLLAGCPSRGSTSGPNAPDPIEEPDPERPAERVAYELDGDRLVLPGPLVFSDTTLDADASAAALAHLRDFLASREDVTLVRIEGHTDGDMTGMDAVVFSGERALQVGRWLQAEGIACERMLVAGFGEGKPVADNSTAEGKAQNRRVDVFIAELRGTAIGGMPVDGGAPATAPVCD